MSPALRIGGLLALGLLLLVGAALLVVRALEPHRDGPPAGDEFDVGVLFVTNRRGAPNPAEVDPGDRFGGERGPAELGRCTVRFNPIPMADDLSRRVEFFVPTEIRAVQSVETLGETAFLDALEGRLGLREEGRPVVVYVHGYAYGFARTCRMGAELQRMLGDRAAVVMFSWPSDANPVEYVADQVDVEWSVPDLARLLERLAGRFGPNRLRVLAHSIGSRGTLFALAQLRLEGRREPVAEHLVLLAPDFDAAAFARQFPLLKPMADRVTLYASDNDTPLTVSETLHGHPRLGQAGEALTVLPGVETVDVTALGRYHPSGHEYFYYHPVVADDLVASLLDGAAGHRHPHGVRRQKDGGEYWALLPPGEGASAAARSDSGEAP